MVDLIVGKAVAAMQSLRFAGPAESYFDQLALKDVLRVRHLLTTTDVPIPPEWLSRIHRPLASSGCVGRLPQPNLRDPR